MIAELVLVTNIAFTVCFDTKANIPRWVAYDLEPHEVVRMKRLDFPFHADPRFPGTDLDAAYRGSGYDRGHMAPAADFNFDFNALYETYAFSNICPQDPKLNRGKWADEEAELRELAKGGTVHILVFPGYDAGSTNRVGTAVVPDAFFKVAWGWFGVRLCSFPNRPITPREPVRVPQDPAR